MKKVTGSHCVFVLRRTKSIDRPTLQLPGIGERGESRPPNADDLLLESFNSTLLARSNFEFQYEPLSWCKLFSKQYLGAWNNDLFQNYV